MERLFIFNIKIFFVKKLGIFEKCIKKKKKLKNLNSWKAF